MTKTYILRDILELSTEFIANLGFKNPRLESELLLSGFLNIKRLEIYLQFDKPVTENELDEFRELLKRRANHEPSQYILGKSEFYGLNFKVNKSVLIPRMDTEILVEEVLQYLKKCDKQIKILEIGTGSGCISIALAKFYENCEIDAIDISDNALNIAKENAELNEVSEKIKFYKKDILGSVKNMSESNRYDIIVSNPPYISIDEMLEIDAEVKNFEPNLALTDKGNGLLFYKRFAEISPSLLKKNGSLFVEIGYKQGNTVKEIFRTVFKDVKIIKDISGNDRVIAGTEFIVND